MLKIFRPIWIGVIKTPQGNPHQPAIALIARSLACDLIPHFRHEICWVLFQWVSTSADQT